MKPLIFLFWRQFVNGIKRTATTPKRLIPTILFVGYYVFAVFMPLMRSQSVGTAYNKPLHVDLALATAAVFYGLCFVTLLQVLSFRSYGRTSRSADIDVLFTMPLEPKKVLTMRILRDIVRTTILPVMFTIFYLVMYRGTGSLPVVGGGSAFIMVRLGIMSTFLIGLVGACAGYADALVFRRDLEDARRKSKIFGWALFGLISLALLYIAVQIRANPTIDQGVAISQNPFVRLVFAPATVGTWLTMSPAGSWISGVAAIGAFALMTAACLTIAYRNVDWFYDISASSGSDAQRMEARKGDLNAMMQLAAQQGRFKKIKKSSRFLNLKMTGIWAFLWREIVTGSRSVKGPLILVVIATIYSLFPIFIFSNSDAKVSSETLGVSLEAVQIMAAFFLGLASGNSGFQLSLRKVELLKPLPFKASAIALAEILARVWLAFVVLPITAVIVVIIRPEAFVYELASVMATSTFAAVTSAVTMSVALMFPDQNDPAQRSLNGIVSMLAVAIAIAPGAIVLIVTTLTMHAPLMGGAVAFVVNCLVLALACKWAGSLYESYQPNE